MLGAIDNVTRTVREEFMILTGLQEQFAHLAQSEFVAQNEEIELSQRYRGRVVNQMH